VQQSGDAALHRWFLALLATGFLLVVGLLEFTFLRFPSSVGSSGTGPKANVAIWLGADGARLAYLGLAAVYAGLYLWVGSQSLKSASAWRPGALCGLVLGGVWLVVNVLVDWLPALAPLRSLGLLALLGLAFLAGLLGARATGLARDGALAGFWCGLVAAVLIAGSIVAVDNAFATTLVNSTWANDPTCPQPAGPAFAGCEIGDDLGFVATVLTLVPLLLSGVGALGGVLAASTTARPESRNASPPETANRLYGWRAPLVFSGAMLALFVAEITLKLV
jgi:hypothetical protein